MNFGRFDESRSSLTIRRTIDNLYNSDTPEGCLQISLTSGTVTVDGSGTPVHASRLPCSCSRINVTSQLLTDHALPDRRILLLNHTNVQPTWVPNLNFCQSPAANAQQLFRERYNVIHRPRYPCRFACNRKCVRNPRVHRKPKGSVELDHGKSKHTSQYCAIVSCETRIS